MSRRNAEVRNALMSTVSKLYEGLFPAHDILLRERVQRKLGSRFLSVERDNDSEVDPVIRRNLEDYYEEANGINLIEFSRSPQFFPSKTDLYYSFEEVKSIARRSKHTEIRGFLNSMKTRKDFKKFGTRTFYILNPNYDNVSFFGLEKIEGIKNKIFLEIDRIIKLSGDERYCLSYVRSLLIELISPYCSNSENYNSSMYKGIKGGPISSDYQTVIRWFEESRKIKIAELFPVYASEEIFEKYAIKFNLSSPKNCSKFKSSDQEKFYKKHGIPTKAHVEKIYTREFLDRVCPDRVKYRMTKEQALYIQKRMYEGQSMASLGKEFGVSSSKVRNLLSKYNLDYPISNEKKEINPREIKKMLLEGLTYAQIAPRYNVSPVSIRNRVKEHGLEKYRKKGVQESISVKEVKKLILEGKSLSEVGRILGSNSQMIKKIVDDNNIPFK